MENLLNPDTGLIIWTVLTFVILLLVLGRFGWKPLLKSLEEREAGIRRAIEDANTSRQSAQALEARLQQDLAESQSRMQELLRQAQADGQKLREQILKEAHAEAERIAEQTRQQLEEERAKLLREMRQQVAGLSIQVAEKLLRHSVKSKENDALVQEVLRDLGKEAKKN